MKQLFIPFILCAASMAFTGCTKVDSSDLKDDVPFNQSYVVIYNKTENTTYVSAMFRVRDANGAKVKLDNGSSVAVNGQSGNSANPLEPTLYSWQFPGLTDVTMVLTKKSSKITNYVRTSDIGDLSFPASLADTLHKNADYSFVWEGAPRSTNEWLSVSISGRSMADPTMNASKNKDITGTTVNITQADLADIRPGTLTITLERVRAADLDMYDANGGSGAKSISLSVAKEITLQ